METPTQDNQKEIEKEARKRARELRKFYSHLFLYMIISLFLGAISMLSSPDYFWAIWPILGWGIGVSLHALGVFGFFGIGSKSWEERKVQEYMLAQQKGLSASQVRALLRDELDEVATASPSDLERVIARLENIEAIVTSQDWDNLEGDRSTNGQKLLADDIPEAEGDSEKAKRLARRVR